MQIFIEFLPGILLHYFGVRLIHGIRDIYTVISRMKETVRVWIKAIFYPRRRAERIYHITD